MHQAVAAFAGLAGRTHPRSAAQGRDGSDIDDGASRLDQQWRESLRRRQQAPHVRVVQALRGLDVRVQERHHAHRPRVVDQDVQPSAGLRVDDFQRLLEGIGRGHVQLQRRDGALGGELGVDLRGVPRCGEDVEATVHERGAEGGPDPAGAAAGHESVLGGHTRTTTMDPNGNAMPRWQWNEDGRRTRIIFIYPLTHLAGAGTNLGGRAW